MAEINTTQAGKLGTKNKLAPNEDGGRVRVLASKMPDTYSALATGDTIFIGRIPINSRLLSISTVSSAEASTLSIGIRSMDTQEVISATAIANALSITAGVTVANNGEYIANGAEYVTDEMVDVYATAGAAIAANTAMKFEIFYVVD